MKKILFIISILAFKIGGSQTYPIPQNLGRSPSTLVSTNSIRADQGVILGAAFSDTTAANLLPYLKNYPGAMIFTTGNNSVYFRNSAATAWILAASSSGSSVNIYNSDGTLSGNRTLTGNNNSLTFTGLSSFKIPGLSGGSVSDSILVWSGSDGNVRRISPQSITGPCDVTISVSSDSLSIYICDCRSDCDTIAACGDITPYSSIQFVSDTTISICSIDPDTGVMTCDTCAVPRQNVSIYQNWITSPFRGGVEFGGYLSHDTYNNTGYFKQTFAGFTALDYPYKFSQEQYFYVSTGMQSWLSRGSGLTGEIDSANVVKLGVNYIGATFPIEGGGDMPAYMNGKIGYMINVNATGNGPLGMRMDKTTSKVGGLLIHTLDIGNTDAVTVFGSTPPGAALAWNMQPNTMDSTRIAVFHNDKTFQLLGYPSTRNDGAVTSASTKLVYVDASGNLKVGTATFGGSFTPAALSKTDDTNVTLTLGGTPLTALLQATSLTLGWTGQLGVTRGGTGLSSVAQGDLLYGSASNTYSLLNKSGTANQFLGNGGTSNNPAWATITAGMIGSGAALTKTDDTNVTLTLGGSPSTALLAASSLTLGWTGTLAVPRGGIGVGTLASNGVLYGNGTSAVQALAVNSGALKVLSQTSSGAPVWTDPATLSVYTASNGITLASQNFKLGGSFINNTEITNAGGFEVKIHMDEDDDNVGIIGDTYGSLIGFQNGSGWVRQGTTVGTYSGLNFAGSQSQLIASSLAGGSALLMNLDSIKLQPSLGKLIIDTLTNNTAQNTLIGWTTTSGVNRGNVGYVTLSGLTLASGVLSVNSGAGMVYPGAGIPISTGSAWSTSISNSSTVGQVLRVTGASTYAFGAVDLADGDAVTGLLPIANAGTGSATTSQNFAFIGPTSGSGAPSFRALVAGDLPATSPYAWQAVMTAGNTSNLAALINKDAIAVTPTDALVLANATAATVGVPVQQSPRIRLRSSVWNTTATAATNTDDWDIESVPVSGLVPKGVLKFKNSANGAAYTTPVSMTAAGAILVGDGTNALPSIAFASQPNTGIYHAGANDVSFVSNGGRQHAFAGADFYLGLGSNTSSLRLGAASNVILQMQNGASGGGQLNFTTAALAAGIGFDFQTDAILKIRTRAQTGDASLTALNLSASGYVDATSGYRVAGAAASRKMLVGNGTNFVPSTETWAVPGTSGNVLVSDGTNWTSAAQSTLVTTVPTLQQVLTAGNTASAQMFLTDGSDIYFSASGGDVQIGQQTANFLHINEAIVDYRNAAGTEHYMYLFGNQSFTLSQQGAGGFGKRLLIDANTYSYIMGDIEDVENGGQIGIDDHTLNVAWYDNTAHTGKFGINTQVPDEELHVVGSVKIVDGTEGNGKVFTSDATGKGSWATPTTGTVTGSGATNKATYWDGANSIAGAALNASATNKYFRQVSSGAPTFEQVQAADLASGTAGISITGTANNVVTNANLTGPITSVGNATSVAAQTGTGSTFVMQASPTLTTPNIGTPSAGVLTNATGLPQTTGLIGGNWKTTYTNGSGVTTEVALGSSGKVWTSNGASSAPTWETPAGGGGGWGTTGTVATLTGASTLAMGTNTFNFSNGMVGIGTTPTVALDVVGDVELDMGASGSIIFGDLQGAANNNKISVQPSFWAFGDFDGGGSAFITGDIATGSIIISSSSSVRVDVLAGTGSRTVLASATGVLSAPVSDRSVKENIKPLYSSIGKIMQLNPVSFEYIKEYKNYGNGTQIGFIAQDIQKILPNSVFTNNSDKKMGYNEIDLVPLLVKAMQEQQLQIEELKAEIKKLKKK